MVTVKQMNVSKSVVCWIVGGAIIVTLLNPVFVFRSGLNTRSMDLRCQNPPVGYSIASDWLTNNLISLKSDLNFQRMKFRCYVKTNGLNWSYCFPYSMNLAEVLKPDDFQNLDATLVQPNEMVGYPRRICNCFRKIQVQQGHRNRNTSKFATSTCGREASELGTGQRVISFSLYINEQEDIPRFFDVTEQLLQEIRILFPGWVIRIYTNVPAQNPNSCKLICIYPHLYWCDITNVPGMGNLESMNGRAWRFLVMGDPTVDIFLIRDLDYQATLRERVAVSEWEASKLPFHSIRDHPWHSVGMLGGLWGAKNYLLGDTLSKKLQNQLITEAKKKLSKGWDQEIVNQCIYKYYCKLTLAHDSYLCGIFPDFNTLPFSIQRNGGEMIGLRLGTEIDPGRLKCPQKCRPKHGKHWEYC